MMRCISRMFIAVLFLALSFKRFISRLFIACGLFLAYNIVVYFSHIVRLLSRINIFSGLFLAN